MKLIKAIPVLLVVMLLLGSCVKEELAGGKVPEGEPTLMKLSLNASFRNEPTQSRAGLPEADENKFSDVRVMIFKPSGEIVTNYKTTYPTPTNNPSLNINTLSGNNRSVYIFANMVDAVDKRLISVQTLTNLNAIQTTVADGLTGKALSMTGTMTGVDIAPGANSIIAPVQMEFMAAKLTLKVINKTPLDNQITILGWDIENSPQNSYLILNGGSDKRVDANDGKEGDDNAWFSTFGGTTPFDEIDPVTKTATLTRYFLENRRGKRVDRLPLPTTQYPGMGVDDADHRGKAWFAPQRATCIVVHIIHKTPTVAKIVEARIFIGADNHSNYDIERGYNYRFTVTVNGIDDIDIDTNLEPANAPFSVVTTAPLDQMDSHPDFRPMVINAINGEATIEILDSQGRSFDDTGFDATWVKVSPLNLMYHQVKQADADGDWQQVGNVGSFVRPKYIPHKSIRAILSGTDGWNAIPTGKENDDVMSFADATYRMCYKVTAIPFVANAITNKALYVYADDYPVKDGKRSAQIKVTFHSNNSPAGADEVLPPIVITQNGYLDIYDENVHNAGLAVLNEDGSPSDVIRKFGIEQFEELTIQLYPFYPPHYQKIENTQWGFYLAAQLYNKADQYRNGRFSTANTVYTDVSRVNNQPTGFGKTASSYRPKYGRGSVLSEPYKGANSGIPYYQPAERGWSYQPIYYSSAARYCHEKNRDLNGDGIIDASETIWYLPSQQELQVIYITNTISFFKGEYWSATESNSNSNRSWSTDLIYGSTAITDKNKLIRVRCARVL